MEQIPESELRVWKVLSLVAVLGFLCLGVWWMFSLPMVGEGGIFLALGATLMPLFWEKIGVIGKMSWVAMLFLLLAVEYRAIDKEHKDYTEKEKTARREERESFDNVLGKQQAGVKDILHQQEQDVKDILNQEQRHFERTLARLITSHRQEERDFSGLLGKQESLFQKQQEMIDSANGHLLPGDKETPSLVSLGCDKWVLAGDNTYLISVGETTFMVTKFPYVPLGFSDFNPPPNSKFKGIGKYSEVISISKSADGLLVLTLDLRNADGSLMARFDEDGFEVGNGFKGRHPNKSTLIIEDSHGARVLKVAYMNKNYLSIEGSIVVDGKVIVNTFENQHFCLPPNAGLEIMQEPPR